MELTDKQKIKLVDAVGMTRLLRHLPQQTFVHILDLHSYFDIEQKLGCSRSWITHRMRVGHIPEPSQKVMRRWYFTADEVAQIEKVWKKLASEKK
ncbi:MAG: hypothetical protein ABGW78_08005 [Pirellulales bacterium]